MYYTQIGQDGFVQLSQFTENPDAEVPEGSRLLPDNGSPAYDHVTEFPVRVEPVPEDAKEVVYEIHKRSVIEIANAMRGYRDAMIARVEWRVARCQRLARLELPQVDDAAELDAYIQALADVPEQEGFPSEIVWPKEPGPLAQEGLPGEIAQPTESDPG